MWRPLFAALSPAGPHARLSTLIFHRVLPEPDPLFPGEVDAARFDRLCGWLRRWFNVLPYDDAVARLREGRLPSRALAITFDDGYEDNRSVALPILLRHRLCATFFVATGFLDGGRMWNDTLIEAVRRTREPVLDLTGLECDGIDDFGVHPIGDVASRRQALDRLLPRAKYLAPAARLRFAAQVAERAHVHPPTDLMMRSSQVRELHEAGMQIGAHTVSHPILAKLDERAVATELGESRRCLQAIIDAPVTLFAYPNGRPGDDYDERTVSLAKDCGYVAAASTIWGSATCRSDMFQLPRFTPWDTSRGRFAARMAANLRRT
jgi:peptidoglycan/xylan/chitin deacetylase (PgdA/CDA1 family)